jgi:glycosyltransferase involved in cell wall biosynthesis
VDEKYGGLASSMPELCRAIDRTGRFTSRLAALCEEEEVTPSSFSPGVVSRFPAGRLRWLLDSRLRRRLEAVIRQADIVHVHGLWREYSVLTSRICRQLGKPYLVSAHGMLQPWTLNDGGWKKRAYLSAVELPVLRGAVGLRALTAVETTDYRAIGLDNAVSVIPNGVAIPEGLSPRDFLDAFPHLLDRRLVLFLGRIHPKKGIDLLCRAWARLEKNLPDVQLVIAGPGEGNSIAALSRLIRELDIEGRVTLTGMLRGHLKWSALAASTIFVLPSHSEGFSVSILESLGSGLPALVSRNCHFPEITEEGCGWEIDAEEDQLAHALARALATEPLALARMAGKGKQLVNARYTWDAVGNRAADMLEAWSTTTERCDVRSDVSPCRQ